MEISLLFVAFFASVSLTESFIFSSKPKCPIKKYKSSKYIIGDQLLIHEDFHDRVKPLETVAKDCKVHLYIKGSYYQLRDPSQQVLVSDADVVIGHGFRFELRDEKDALLCNRVCLSKNPTETPEVKCFLQAVVNHGLTWSKYDGDLISDGTYAANPSSYSSLKTDIQTRCQEEKFKRELFRALRRFYEEKEENLDENLDSIR